MRCASWQSYDAQRSISRALNRTRSYSAIPRVREREGRDLKFSGSLEELTSRYPPSLLLLGTPLLGFTLRLSASLLSPVSPHTLISGSVNARYTAQRIDGRGLSGSARYARMRIKSTPNRKAFTDVAGRKLKEKPTKVVRDLDEEQWRRLDRPWPFSSP